MQAKTKTRLKNNLISLILIICMFVPRLTYAGTESTAVEPLDNQYMELKATTINTIEGKDKQVIFELWSHDIEFKGFDVRFSYDGTKFSPSNLSTNEYTNDETEFFKFENEFKDGMELFTIPYTGSTPDGMRAVVSFLPPVTESEHIKEKDGIGLVVDTKGGVLLGKMSFRMTSDTFDISSFKLETSQSTSPETSPETGVKINLDGGSHHYEKQSTFRFTDATASKNADLLDIKLWTGNKEDSTYKEYPLTPNFDKDTLEYNLELLEYIDKMNLTLTKADEKSTIKMKVPKRDENGNLVFESDGTTIIYEEKEITDLTQEITLNKLGEQDTIIEIEVTAEDTVTTKKYKVTIHRPYGTIKGTIITPYTVSTTGKYTSTVYAYKSSDVAVLFDWDAKEAAFGGKAGVDTVNAELHSLQEEKNVITNDDGTFELTVIPGTYDILVDKPGYLDHIYIYVNVEEAKTIELGTYNLVAGDINKDAIIQIQDIALLKMHNGDSNLIDEFEEKYDLNDDGNVQIKDISIISADNGYIREIEDYRGR